MPITHVSTATSSAANGTSISINRPANYASGDVFIAVFTSNSQNCTPPSGWTELFDEGIDVFRCQVFYKVTGGSEASSYNFSVPSAAPLVGSISAFRGVDTTNPIDIDANFESTTGHSEPYTPPSLSGGSAGRAFYLRAVRRSGTSPLTFTASGVTEVVDTGIYSGGSVCYSFGLYTGTSDYNGLIAPAPGITTSSTESHNVIASWALRASGVPGTMGVTMPLPTMTASGSWSHVAVVDADVPLPTVNVEAFVGEYSGDMDVDVPIAVDVAGSLEPRGPLEAVVPIGVEFEAETRSFGDNAIIWEREERWIVLTQEGYYLGRRTGVDLPMRIDMPLPVVSFTIITFPLAPAVGVTAEAFGATTTGTVSAAAGAVAVTATGLSAQDVSHVVSTSASVSVPGAVVSLGSKPSLVTVAVTGYQPVIPQADQVMVWGEAFGATVATVGMPSTASASATAYSPTISVVKTVSASVEAYNAAVSDSPIMNAPAGHVTVTCRNADAPDLDANAEHAAASITAYAPTVDIESPTTTHAEAGPVYVWAGMNSTAGDGLVKFTQTIGNGSNTSFTVTHNFGSRDVVVTVYDNATYEVVEPTVTHTTTNAVTIDFAAAPTTNAYRVVVLYSQN